MNDEFTYRVTNEDGVFTIATVSVAIEPRIAAAFEENSSPVTITEKTEDTTTEEPEEQEVVQANEEPEQTTEAEQEEEQEQVEETLPQFEEDVARDTRSTAVLGQFQARDLTDVNVRQTEFSARESIVVTQHQQVLETIEHAELQVLNQATYDIKLDVHIPSPNTVTSNPSFQKGLTNLENEFLEFAENDGARIQLAEDTILGASFSVSVGALAWVLRGGAMFGSMMAFTPLWKFIEIGQVSVMVGQSKRGADQSGDDDQVESLFDSK